MDSLHASADSVRAHVSSTSTCTAATTALLTDLLLPRAAGTDLSTTSVSKVRSATLAKRSSKVAAAKRPVKITGKENVLEEYEGTLSSKEKSVLATEVINATLKTLSDAAKETNQRIIKQQVALRGTAKASTRRTLRRSSSTPPLQPRLLNRVSSSPNLHTRHSRAPSSTSICASGIRAAAECARIAFLSLRTLQNCKSSGVELPSLQLENGMSVLIGKLLSLGLDDLAMKEIKILKRRLFAEDVSTNHTATRATTILSRSATPLTFAELLDFGKSSFTGLKLGLAIATQLQVLRLMITSRKQSHVEAVLPFLMPEYPSSPSRLLTQLSREAKGEKERDKAIRQLQTLSETLFALCPSVAPSDDMAALDSRQSVRAEIAIQIQKLAFSARISWWNMAGHTADITKELFDPLLRCLSTFARRSQCGTQQIYRISSIALKDTENLLSEFKIPRSKSISPSLLGIYRLLGSLSKDAGLIDEAISWTDKMRMLRDPKLATNLTSYAITARLVSLYLQRKIRDAREEELIFSLLEGLESPFTGGPSEVEDLFVEVSNARRAANSLLADTRSCPGQGLISDGLQQMCESLIFICPRLSLRVLGDATSTSSPKDLLQYEQRRQLITLTALHSIDSSLFLIKTLSSEERLSWDLLDSKLQDCLLLYDRLEVCSRGVLMENGTPPPAYCVRISNIYYSHYLDMRRVLHATKEAQEIKVLRRTIDCIRERSPQEKRAAFICTKLERMAEVFKRHGRFDDLYGTLIILRDEHISQGVLAAVREAASSMPLSLIWTLNDESATLGRTLQSLVKIQVRYPNISTSPSLGEACWSGEERATVLEYQLEALYCNQPPLLSHTQSLVMSVVQGLLSLYEVNEYPIRRLRTLIRLLSMDEHVIRRTLPDMEAELMPYIAGDVVIRGSKDEKLEPFMPNLRALAIIGRELGLHEPRLDRLKQGLQLMVSVRAKCKDSADLKRYVDNFHIVLSHLRSVGDYLQTQGHESIRLTTLRLIVEINELVDISSNLDALIRSLTDLGSQWLSLGYSGKAGIVFDRAKCLIREGGVSYESLVRLHLSCAEYYLIVGTHEKSEEQLDRAQALHASRAHGSSDSSPMLRCKIQNSLLASHAFLLSSKVALAKGSAQLALSHSKQSVRLLRRIWNTVEERVHEPISKLDTSIPHGASKGLDEPSQIILSQSCPKIDGGTPYIASSLWLLVTPLFESLAHLSSLYAHYGMFQETLHYAQEAHKFATDTRSSFILGSASMFLGSIWLKSGELDRGSEFLAMAKQHISTAGGSNITALLAYHTGTMNGLLGDRDAELSAYESAQATLTMLSDPDYISGLDRVLDTPASLEESMAALVISKSGSTASRKTPGRKKIVSRLGKQAQPKSTTVIVLRGGEEYPRLNAFKTTLLRKRAWVLIHMRRTAESASLLSEAGNCLTSHTEIIEQALGTARQLLVQGLEQMATDSVYSVLQDSTISFPSVAALGRCDKGGEKLSVNYTSPPRNSTKPPKDGRSKSPVPSTFFDKLRGAQDHLIRVQSIAIANAPMAVIHNISVVLSSVAILLSASGQARSKQLAHPIFASSFLENARTMALRRQGRIFQAESKISVKADSDCWPTPTSSESKTSSIEFSNDVSRFQQDYIDIIPKSWNVVSVAISDSRNELSVTKFQAGYSPFVLRLPLGRHNNMDADEEVFGYEQGRVELLEIIELANSSAHDARDLTSKDAKSAWWEERGTLDSRLRDLLENIEKVWLGGFTGIFSQHARRPDLLARFQKSFQNILDKYLPSRRKSGTRRSSQRITLDPRILELFIGLGNASDDEIDFSEPLTDLLYFVVDVLQFHGELNAYAEIDFDSIVIETQDALRGYHTAANMSPDREVGRHTILILDKTLHRFPWESLPCLKGHAVSRLPSLGCLRDQILRQQESAVEQVLAGHYIDRRRGYYVLNPEGDLKNTQITFQKILQGLKDWTGVVKKVPEEEEIKSALEGQDLYLYFGHGSGAQYIRSKEIRKLERCAVTWLMGCSSGALSEVGEFEPYGPALNYLHAGCPALVATLWDVTDKDIDRFAKSALVEWGLFEDEIPSSGRGKRRIQTVEVKPKISLVEAVATARGACNMKYLNAAAVCVYGVPVYFK